MDTVTVEKEQKMLMGGGFVKLRTNLASESRRGGTDGHASGVVSGRPDGAMGGTCVPTGA